MNLTLLKSMVHHWLNLNSDTLVKSHELIVGDNLL